MAENNMEPQAGQTPRVVADLPGDDEMRANLQNQIQNDGRPSSCGINNAHDQNAEPTMAPGLDNDQRLGKEASKKERQRGDYTEVTSLYLDRTPED